MVYTMQLQSVTNQCLQSSITARDMVRTVQHELKSALAEERRVAMLRDQGMGALHERGGTFLKRVGMQPCHMALLQVGGISLFQGVWRGAA
eukprot:scaffold50486_cov24-Tisochrysis_lutea.AAC.1